MTDLKQLQQEMEKEMETLWFTNENKVERLVLKYMQKVADMYEKELEIEKAESYCNGRNDIIKQAGL